MSFRVLCHGEALIDFIAEQKGKRLRDVASFRGAPGGAPANVAVGLAKLGTPSAFLGMVGDDEFGYRLRETLQSQRVDVSALKHTRKAGTTLAFVSVREDGERSFAFYRNPGADLMLTADDVEPSLFEKFEAFHFGSLSLSAEPCRSATLRAVEIAKEKGLLISFDPNLRLPLWADADAARAGIMLGLPHADVLKISDEEGEFLFGAGDPETWARKAAEAGKAKVVLVTLGAKGAIALVGGQIARHKGFKVEVADTTGAGDGFVAGFLHSLSRHAPRKLEELTAEEVLEGLTFANAVGALTCTKAGAIPALPTASEADRLARHGA